MTHIRRWRAVSLAVLALLLVVSPAEAKKSKKSTSKSKTKQVQTGDSLPKKPVADAQCHDGKGVRWLAHEPITPLAIVRKGSIVEAGQHCCAPWARKGSHWFSIDSMGQIAGTFEVAGGEGYDVTQCYELSMKALQGNVGAGLYVNAGGSALWNLSRSNVTAGMS